MTVFYERKNCFVHCNTIVCFFMRCIDLKNAYYDQREFVKASSGVTEGVEERYLYFAF